MMKTTIAIWVAASLALITCQAQGDTTESVSETSVDRWLDGELGSGGGLTADEVARRASYSSFDIARRRAELGAAAADLDRALAAYLPRAQLTARYTRLSNESSSGAGSVVVAPGAGPGPIAPGTQLVNAPLEYPSISNQYVFQSSLTVPISDYFTRISDNRASAEHAKKSASYMLSATQRQVAADARVAYYSWVRARLSVVVAEQALGMARAHEADAGRLLEAGTGSKADLLRVESEVAESEQVLASAKVLARVAEEQVRIAMHDDSSRAYRIGEDVRTPVAPIRATDERKLWSSAIDKRPETASYRYAAKARSRAADAERAAMLPRFDLFAHSYYSNPGQRTFPQKDEFRSSWEAGAQLTWSLNELTGARAAGRAEDARAAAAIAEARAFADKVRLEVVSALGEAKKADSAVKTTARQLGAAEESYRIRRAAFQNGRATSVELIDSETSLTQARFDALAARVDARVARVRLAYAMGDELGGSRRSPRARSSD